MSYLHLPARPNDLLCRCNSLSMHLIYSDGYSKKKKKKLNKCTWDSNPHSIKIQFISRSYSRIDYSSDVRLINRFFYQALQIALKKIQILRQLAYKQLDRGEMIPLTSLAKVINYTRRKMLISHHHYAAPVACPHAWVCYWLWQRLIFMVVSQILGFSISHKATILQLVNPDKQQRHTVSLCITLLYRRPGQLSAVLSSVRLKEAG